MARRKIVEIIEGRRDNGTGSVYKMNGRRKKPWVARAPLMVIDGVKKRPLLGTFKTEREADAALLNCKYVALGFSHSIKMDDLFAELYRRKERKGMSKKSLEAVQTSYNHIARLGSCVFNDLTVADFQRVIDELVDQGSSYSKCVKVKSIVSQLYDVAIQNKIGQVNYAKYIDVTQAVEGKIPPFPDEDIRTLFHHDEDRIAKSSLILAYTGFRINEFLSLKKKENVHLKEGYLVGGSKTEAGKNRIVPIHFLIMPYIKFFMEEFKESEWLFSRAGERVTPNYYRKYYHAPLVERLGLSPYNPHSFRHTFATKMRKAKLDSKTIESVFGHTDARFTDARYVDLPTDYLIEEVNKIK